MWKVASKFIYNWVWFSITIITIIWLRSSELWICQCYNCNYRQAPAPSTLEVGLFFSHLLLVCMKIKALSGLGNVYSLKNNYNQNNSVIFHFIFVITDAHQEPKANVFLACFTPLTISIRGDFKYIYGSLKTDLHLTKYILNKDYSKPWPYGFLELTN